MLIVKAEVAPCTDISDASREAVELAQRLNAVVQIHFNGIMLLASPDDAEDSLVVQYHLRRTK
jgi:hypothetical protein